MYNTLTKAIKTLAIDAQEIDTGDQAMKYSQAALNLAHTLAVIRDVERQDFTLLVDK